MAASAARCTATFWPRGEDAPIERCSAFDPRALTPPLRERLAQLRNGRQRELPHLHCVHGAQGKQAFLDLDAAQLGWFRAVLGG